MKMQVLRTVVASVALTGVVYSSNVFSEGNVSPFLSISTLTDNNIFRLDDIVEESSLNESVTKSDQLYRTAVGLNVDWKVRRQVFVFSASLLDTRYQSNSQLDNLGKKFSARWNWLLGGKVTGVISADQSTSLSSFEDTSNNAKVERTTNSFNVSTNWRYHPDWRIGFGLRNYESTYDSDLRNFSNLAQVTSSVNLDYLAKSGSRVGLKFQFERGDYPNRVDTFSIDDQFTQDSFLATVLWSISEKSNFISEFGLVSRNHPDIKERDYEGVNVTLRYNWSPTGKLNLFAEGSRKVASSEDLLASYSENTLAKLTARWALADKMVFSGVVSQEKRDYTGQTDLINGLESTLKDIYNTQSLGLLYKPHRNFNVNMGYTQSTRSSNQLLRDFTSDLWSLTLKINL